MSDNFTIEAIPVAPLRIAAHISAEKLASSEYNTNVFNFSEPAVRKLLADIQVEEQNYAEMLYKYKTVNAMK